MKKKLTAIIPVYNEAENIEAVIQSVDFADEIMVVDSYSTDNTLALARKHTGFILQREYRYSASQKNWAIPQANNEWILLVDADERVSPELREEILELMQQPDDEITAYTIFRENYFMGRKMNHCGLDTDKVTRLFKRDQSRYEDKNVHAKLQTEGKTGMLKGKLLHNTYKSFDAFVEKKNRYAWWSAKDHIKKTPRPGLYHFLVKPVWSFFWHYIVRLGFLDGLPGLVFCGFMGYGVFTRYVKIWLIRKNLK